MGFYESLFSALKNPLNTKNNILFTVNNFMIAKFAHIRCKNIKKFKGMDPKSTIKADRYYYQNQKCHWDYSGIKETHRINQLISG